MWKEQKERELACIKVRRSGEGAERWRLACGAALIWRDDVARRAPPPCQRLAVLYVCRERLMGPYCQQCQADHTCKPSGHVVLL
jgi:hypothetical protein